MLLRLKIAIINISAISFEERKSDNELRNSARAASQDLRRLHGFYTSEIIFHFTFGFFYISALTEHADCFHASQLQH